MKKTSDKIHGADECPECAKLRDELMKAQSEVEAANRKKSIFLAYMSNKLRKPLDTIIGFSVILLQQGRLDKKESGYVNDILESGKKLFSLVDDILNIARLDRAE